MKKYKTALKYVWLGLLVTILVIYLIKSDDFTTEGFSAFFHDNKAFILSAYVTLVFIRSIFFIPATVVLLLGMALYPNDFWFLLILNMAGIVMGATIIYFAGKLFTAEDFFSAKHQEKLPVIKSKINEYGFWIVLAWSFFPIVPTDLVCYISGATHMKYLKFISAVILGEIVLVSTYLYTGESLYNWIF